MRNLFWLKFATGLGLMAGALSAGTIEYEVTPLSGNLYQFDYSVSGFTFAAQQQLDIRFDPTLYGSLSNGVAPAGFSVTLLQTNNPPGDYGDYTALAQINNPSTSGLFSVDAVYLGEGLPGPQPYFINQFNSDGVFVDTVEGGFTEQPDSIAPEPSTLTLISVALLFGGFWTLRRRLHDRGF